jgi:hypothetical protein
MAVGMRITTLTPCSLVEVHGYFGERTASVLGVEERGSATIFEPSRSVGLLDVAASIFSRQLAYIRLLDFQPRRLATLSPS